MRIHSNEARLPAVGLFLVTLMLFSFPWWVDGAKLRLFGELYSYLALAILWNLLAGYGGLMSVGQQSFVGVGAYAFFIATTFMGLHPFVAIPLSFLAALAVAAVFAPLLFRLEGAYFAIGTWVAAETISLVFGMIPATGSGAGMSLPVNVVRSIAASRPEREAVVYWLLLAVSMGTLAGAYALLRSRAGLALMAIRDNGLAAASLGIDIWRTKFAIYLSVSAVTGVVGAIIFLQKLRISPDAAFSLNDWTVVVIFIVVIGGIGRMEGAIVGTLVFFVIRETLADFGPVYLIVLGVIAILVMAFSRQGIWGLVENRLGYSLLPTGRTMNALDVSKEP